MDKLGNRMRRVADRLAPLPPKPIKIIPEANASHARTEPFFDCLTRLQYSPGYIIDIGANRGNWTRTAMRFFPNARYTLFEPQASLLAGSDFSTNPNVQIFNVGVGPTSGVMKLTTHERDDSFSFAVSSEVAEKNGHKQIDTPVVALDEFLRNQGIPFANMLKIDAEGWDLEVLRGAVEAVENADIVLVEAAVLNKSFTNTIDRVINEMTNRGLVLFDVTDLNRTTKQNALWLVELAFVKQDSFLNLEVTDYF